MRVLEPPVVLGEVAAVSQSLFGASQVEPTRWAIYFGSQNDSISRLQESAVGDGERVLVRALRGLCPWGPGDASRRTWTYPRAPPELIF